MEKYFYLMDYFAEKYNIVFDKENKYYSIVSNMKKYLNENIVTLGNFEICNVKENKTERDVVINLLAGLNIQFIKQNICAILRNRGLEIEDDFCEGVSDIEMLSQLTDTELLSYLFTVLSTVTYNQNGNLLLVKYSVAIWNTGFHNFAKVCRGRVLDMETLGTISYPFDKFFNLNEVADTNEDLIKNYIEKSDYAYATEKIDGSTVSVTKYNGKPLITTNGSFENDQTKWAIELFNKKYSAFLPNMKDGFTYIFELIHPENKIVLDYNGEKALYLLNIRDLSTGKLLHLDAVHNVAKEFGFSLPEVYDFKDLDTMVYLAHNMKNANKEGWVIRIGVGENEYMVKLKLDEYFDMHKAFGKVKLGWVYKHLINGDLDDFLGLCGEAQRAEVFAKLEIIRLVREKIKEKAINEAEKYLAKHNANIDVFLNDKTVMIEIVRDILSSKSNVKHLALQHLKEPIRVDTSINRIYYKHMKPFFEEFGYNASE